MLKIVPAYDPGAGGVSKECKRDAEIFHRELNKFTLWALKSKQALLFILRTTPHKTLHVIFLKKKKKKTFEKFGVKLF